MTCPLLPPSDLCLPSPVLSFQSSVLCALTSVLCLLSPTPHFTDWFLFRQQPKNLAAYKQQLAAIDPVLFAPKLAPAPVFFQFASKDFYITAEEAAEFYAAAGPRKQLATYEADHGLHPPRSPPTAWPGWCVSWA